jgi:hypothetical protein
VKRHPESENAAKREKEMRKRKEEKKEVKRPKRNNQFHLFTLVIFIY